MSEEVAQLKAQNEELRAKLAAKDAKLVQAEKAQEELRVELVSARSVSEDQNASTLDKSWQDDQDNSRSGSINMPALVMAPSTPKQSNSEQQPSSPASSTPKKASAHGSLWGRSSEFTPFAIAVVAASPKASQDPSPAFRPSSSSLPQATPNVPVASTALPSSPPSPRSPDTLAPPPPNGLPTTRRARAGSVLSERSLADSVLGNDEDSPRGTYTTDALAESDRRIRALEQEVEDLREALAREADARRTREEELMEQVLELQEQNRFLRFSALCAPYKERLDAAQVSVRLMYDAANEDNVQQSDWPSFIYRHAVFLRLPPARNSDDEKDILPPLPRSPRRPTGTSTISEGGSDEETSPTTHSAPQLTAAALATPVPIAIGAAAVPAAVTRSPPRGTPPGPLNESLNSRSNMSGEWVPDRAVTRCNNCTVKFTLFKRRHHCRHCKNIFCDDCSTKRIPLPRMGYPDAVRVCDSCVFLINHELASAGNGPARVNIPGVYSP